MSEILNCNCGEEPRLEIFKTRTGNGIAVDYKVVCSKCGMNTGIQQTKEWAIKVWNTRKPVENAQPVTNGDVVRQMTNKKLARNLECPYEGRKEPDDCGNISCFDCTYRWLKQEAEQSRITYDFGTEMKEAIMRHFTRVE